MTAIDRTRAAAAFKTYTDAYDAANPRIALKIEHTYHVAEACDAVAREQGWSPQDIDLAWLCGLLHDMGRFEQLRRWDTFKDAESMSHAALGVEVLFGENPADAPATTSIRDFIDDPVEDELIRASIAYHSDFRLPAQLDERARALLRYCARWRQGRHYAAPSPTAPSTPSSKWMRTCFLPATSRHRRWLPLTSTAASRAMSAMSPRTTWWGLSALCLSSSIRQAARWAAQAGRYLPPARRTFWHRAALYRPRHASDLGTPKERDASLAGRRLALELGQELFDDFDDVADNFILRSAEDGGIWVLVDGNDALRAADAG